MLPLLQLQRQPQLHNCQANINIAPAAREPLGLAICVGPKRTSATKATPVPFVEVGVP